MLLQGKKALILGVANERSLAWGIAQQFKKNGAKLAFSYVGDALKKRVEPLAAEIGADFVGECDVGSDASIENFFKLVASKWGKFDILIHSIGYANKDELQGSFLNTSREGFRLALDISAYSFIGVMKSAAPLMNDGGNALTLTYYGAEKVVAHYNVMGVAKAALEASTRYLAYDLGSRGIRVNAISAGPVKTLAASGIRGFRSILDTAGQMTALRRNISQDEVGKAALYLCSDLASGVTGEIHFVDAGFNTIGLTFPLDGTQKSAE